MKHVGVREFRDHATQYLGGGEPIVVERHGVPIGYYMPAGMQSRKGSKEAKEARARLERTISEVLAETGMTEEELARYFDMSQPLPD
jgi:antitoxin (DNA-binding transcriptional repressor) of toxin-antitoxin stability system